MFCGIFIEIYKFSFLNINLQFSLIFQGFTDTSLVAKLCRILSNIVILWVAEVEPEILKFLIFPTILVCFNFVLDLLTIRGTILKSS